MVKIKRAYDHPDASDGGRYLVDRLWPRGISKDDAQLTGWLKDLAPSDELRQWFHAHPEKWDEFQEKYRAELHNDDKLATIRELSAQARKQTITLVFAAKDTEHNNAVVLKNLIERAGK